MFCSIVNWSWFIVVHLGVGGAKRYKRSNEKYETRRRKKNNMKRQRNKRKTKKNKAVKKSNRQHGKAMTREESSKIQNGKAGKSES